MPQAANAATSFTATQNSAAAAKNIGNILMNWSSPTRLQSLSAGSRYVAKPASRNAVMFSGGVPGQIGLPFASTKGP
jgi:hypothetical protein